MLTVLSRSIPTLAALAFAAPIVFAGLPSTAQVYGHSRVSSQDIHGYRQGAVCGDRCSDRRYERRYDQSYQGQVDRPGDYRCDAYWDRGRTDCDAGWRDRGGPWQRNDGRRQSAPYGGPAVYYGEYGRPDVVYAGRYGGHSSGVRHSDRYGHDHGQDGLGGRNPQRINWCCAEYRSYDPATGYYIAYSGQSVFCG